MILGEVMPLSPQATQCLRILQEIFATEQSYVAQLKKFERIKTEINTDAVRSVLEEKANTFETTLKKYGAPYDTLSQQNPFNAWILKFSAGITEENYAEVLDEFLTIISTLESKIGTQYKAIATDYSATDAWLRSPVDKPISRFEQFQAWFGIKPTEKKATNSQLIQDKAQVLNIFDQNDTLNALRILPIQRLPRYKLFLQALQALNTLNYVIDGEQKSVCESATTALTAANGFLSEMNTVEEKATINKKFARLLRLTHCYTNTAWNGYAKQPNSNDLFKKNIKNLKKVAGQCVRQWIATGESLANSITTFLDTEIDHITQGNNNDLNQDLSAIRNNQEPFNSTLIPELNLPTTGDEAKHIVQQFIIFQTFLPFQLYIKRRQRFFASESKQKGAFVAALLAKRDEIYNMSLQERDVKIKTAGSLYHYLCQEIHGVMQEKVLNENAPCKNIRGKIFQGDCGKVIYSVCGQLALLDPQQGTRRQTRTLLLHGMQGLDGYNEDKNHLALIANGLRVTQYYLKTSWGKKLLTAEGQPLQKNNKDRQWNRIAQCLSDKLQKIYVEYHHSPQSKQDDYHCYRQSLEALDNAVINLENLAHAGATRSPLYQRLKAIQFYGARNISKQPENCDLPIDLIIGHWDEKQYKKIILQSVAESVVAPFKRYSKAYNSWSVYRWFDKNTEKKAASDAIVQAAKTINDDQLKQNVPALLKSFLIPLASADNPAVRKTICTQKGTGYFAGRFKESDFTQAVKEADAYIRCFEP
jgi:flagellar biosynthesis/type III secretory pathway chaperone